MRYPNTLCCKMYSSLILNEVIQAVNTVLTVNEYAKCVFYTYFLTLKLQIRGSPYLRFYYNLTSLLEDHNFNRPDLYCHLVSVNVTLIICQECGRLLQITYNFSISSSIKFIAAYRYFLNHVIIPNEGTRSHICSCVSIVSFFITYISTTYFARNLQREMLNVRVFSQIQLILMFICITTDSKTLILWYCKICKPTKHLHFVRSCFQKIIA